MIFWSNKFMVKNSIIEDFWGYKYKTLLSGTPSGTGK